MLDRVYKVRSHGERHSKYLLVEGEGRPQIRGDASRFTDSDLKITFNFDEVIGRFT